DGSKHIIEVMRDAACKLANGLHLLALRHLVFEGLLLCRLNGRDNRSFFGALTTQVGYGAHVEADMPLFIARQHCIDGRNARLSCKGSGKRPVESLAVALMHDDLKLRISVNRIAINDRRENIEETRIGAQYMSGGINRCDSHGSRIEEARETHFGRAERH